MTHCMLFLCILQSIPLLAAAVAQHSVAAAVAQHSDVALSPTDAHAASNAMRIMRKESSPPDSKVVFDGIAKSDSWGSQESISGPGSELDVTAPVRECLGRWIAKYNIKVFVDAPCGDANWQGSIPGIDHVKYKGYDIADLPVQHARSKNSQHVGMSFDQLDLTKHSPTEKPDLMMVRDVIQHVPLSMGRQMLLNAKAAGAKYIAVTTFTDGKNSDIAAGSFYQNDIHAHPFSLPSPLESCQNYAQTGPQTHWLPSDRLELIDLSTWSPAEQP
jgi:hypothetical protein